MADSTSISKLLADLGQVKNEAREIYRQYKTYREIEDNLKDQLVDKLHEAGLKSVKGKEYSAVIAERQSIEIKDEAAVIDWLKANPNIDDKVYIGVKRREFSTLATAMLKDTGQMADGTAVETKESLAVRANNPQVAEIAREMANG